jgi:tetratricopeptide (TPR) repeat protein
MVARLHWNERELTLRRSLGDRRQESMCLANLGGSWLALGELFHSRRCCEEALQMARVRGERRSECYPLYHLSVLERRLGNGAQAAKLARSAVDAAVATGIKDFELYTLTALGEAELAAGQLDAAGDAFLRAQDLALQRKLPDQPDNAAGLARLALARGDVHEALRQVERVPDQEAATGVAHQAREQGRVNLVCHLVLARALDPRADAWLQRAHGQLLSTAAKISDEALREGFLANIPDHRAILAAWAATRPLMSQEVE